MVYKINSVIQDRIFVMDDEGNGVIGLQDNDFIKELKYNQNNATETITIEEDSGGYYFVNFTPTQKGWFSYIIKHNTYQPEGWYNDFLVKENDEDDIKSKTDDIKTETGEINTKTDDINNKVDTINNKVDDILTKLLRVLGLIHENVYIDNHVYDINTDALLSARIRIYFNEADVGTDNNVIAEYNMSATYDTNGHMLTYKMVKN